MTVDNNSSDHSVLQYGVIVMTVDSGVTVMTVN